jgi:tRNA modification GTPase
LRDVAGDSDPIEREGIRRALARAENADLRILVFVAGCAPDLAIAELAGADSVLVGNKADLLAAAVISEPSSALLVSARTGQGLDALRARLLTEAEARMGTGDTPAITRARHRSALNECVASLARAEKAQLADLVAEDVRLAVRALGRITGRVEVDDLLDVIFREFCIGK